MRALFILMVACARVVSAQHHPDSLFARQEAMVPMRDGVRLYTRVFVPTASAERLPMLFLRTPYGIEDVDAGSLVSILGPLIDDGYIVVVQDIRGRFTSEGQFVMLRPPRDRRDRKAVDESTDAYDTIEWLLANVQKHNGRVGMLGGSYGGWLTVMAMLDPHPALAAASPQASPADNFLGDDFHHNGAFRLSYGFEYAYSMEATKDNADVSTIIDRFDTYEWYLGLGPLANANSRYFKGKIATWNNFVEHPTYDSFWRRQSVTQWLDRVTVPVLNVAGWWDQEDFYGPLRIYEMLERHDTLHRNFLVVGPWNHGGWQTDGRKLDRLDFGSATGEYYRTRVLAPFFAHYLKDKSSSGMAEALTFRTGANEWVMHDRWPPKDAVTRKLYFRADGKLSFDPPPPSGGESFDQYLSDPANPVPYRPRPIQLDRGWSTWLVQDQRFVDHRPDVLSWVTDPLETDVAISGQVVAHLFASTSGTDSDWIVKLIDVYADPYSADPLMSGYQLMIAGDVFRGRFRGGFDHPKPIRPGVAMEYPIPFSGSDHVFRKGHRIMVQVQSTWFPVIDRNPQRFVPNIYLATSSDFRVATQRIFRSPRRASYVALPVIAR
jgi:putative CocE/NonD family hydrolase